jgi:hypothetical protein
LNYFLERELNPWEKEKHRKKTLAKNSAQVAGCDYNNKKKKSYGGFYNQNLPAKPLFNI